MLYQAEIFNVRVKFYHSKFYHLLHLGCTGYMMSKIKIYFLYTYILFFTISISAMVYDNRFIPLFARPRIIIDGKQSFFATDFFMATGSKAIERADSNIGIPELYGKFDQGRLADAIIATGQPNLLRTDWLGKEIPWNVEGKIQAQAAVFFIHHRLNNWLGIGADWSFMRVNSTQEFFLNCPNLKLGPGDLLEIDQERRAMFTEIGLQRNHCAQLGFNDVDCYLYFGKMWDYTLKLRRIDIGGRLGVLIPSGLTREINNPASIPFGGNGHWGSYVEFDGLFELKEDLKAGLMMRLSKRFAKTKCERISVKGEPYIFGAATGTVDINPGITFVFSPYVMLENLRQGLGLSVQYYLTIHQQDTWKNIHSNVIQNEPCDIITHIEKLSQWGSDYFSLNVFYDFGKEKAVRSLDPILSLKWDVPATFFVSKNISKTNRVSLGVECAF